MINDEKINNLNNKGNNMNYNEAINNLLENIKTDYAKWTTWEEGIERFNNGIRTEDGVVKGVPCKKGDVFKAAGWRGPARYTRGNIFADNQNYFQWTGPNYMR